jgi:DNA-binding transcriptional MerR regulator
MRIGEAADRAGVSTKAVRYYESLGLVTAARLGNGYRDYDEAQVRRIGEIRTLGRLGIPAERTRPFLDCLDAGMASGDDCPASLDTYRAAIADMDRRLAELSERRDALAVRLASATARRAPLCQFTAPTEETP